MPNIAPTYKRKKNFPSMNTHRRLLVKKKRPDVVHLKIYRRVTTSNHHNFTILCSQFESSAELHLQQYFVPFIIIPCSKQTPDFFGLSLFNVRVLESKI